MNTLAKVLATALGAGYSPLAPGTCGTAVAVPLAWALAPLAGWQFFIIAILVTLVGVWAARRSDLAWGTEDSGRIVIDEVAGYLFTVALVPRDSPLILALAFVVFRALDILKPPPVRWLDENLPGGWGVVLDDVAAGVIGGGIMFALVRSGAIEWMTQL